MVYDLTMMVQGAFNVSIELAWIHMFYRINESFLPGGGVPAPKYLALNVIL